MCEQLYRTTDIKFCFNNISRNLRIKRFPATPWTVVTYSMLSFKLWVIYTQVMSMIIFFSYYSNTMEVVLIVWSCLTEPLHVFLLMAATVFLKIDFLYLNFIASLLKTGSCPCGLWSWVLCASASLWSGESTEMKTGKFEGNISH